MGRHEHIEKHRIVGLDIIKIVCALLIYMRHSITMYGCTYSWNNLSLDGFVQLMTGTVMSTFFVISGFSIYYGYYGKAEFDAEGTLAFYKGRLIRIMPAYFLVHIMWLVFGSGTIRTWLVLTPFEASGLQSMYVNIFGVLHNGGSWFVSCILIAYFVFPVMRNMVGMINGRIVLVGLTAGVALFLLYLSSVSMHYQLGDNYTNPIYRAIEFFFGVCLSACLCGWHGKKSKKRLLTIVAITLLMLGLFAASLKYNRYVLAGSIDLLTISMYPTIACLMVLAYELRIPRLETSRVIAYASSLTYYFFILQLILWAVTDKVIKLLDGDAMWNFGKIALSFTLCVAMSVAIKELIEKPIQKYMSAKKNRV